MTLLEGSNLLFEGITLIIPLISFPLTDGGIGELRVMVLFYISSHRFTMMMLFSKWPKLTEINGLKMYIHIHALTRIYGGTIPLIFFFINDPHNPMILLTK